MSVDFSIGVAPRPRFAVVSWPAILAALAVGIALQLLLTLMGYVIGAYATDAVAEADTITLAAALWGVTSMLIAAFVGGYVAARASGLRRTGDGVMHGVVSWATTTLLYAVLATTAMGPLTTGLFGLLGPAMSEPSAPAAVGAAGDRALALQTLGDLGMSAEQAEALLDQAARGAIDPSGATESVGSATLWLTGAVTLSLVLGLLGGMLGARGGRRKIQSHEPMAPVSL